LLKGWDELLFVAGVADAEGGEEVLQINNTTAAITRARPFTRERRLIISALLDNFPPPARVKQLKTSIQRG
jgi:hypothetical protein